MKTLAPAKINLTLEVLSRRPDGYHDICSVLQTIALYDELTFETSETSNEIKLLTRGLPQEENNLVLKAARLLKKDSGIKAGATIVLNKFIPVASGLGGGSTDAAATLMALNTLWRINWPRKKLAEIAGSVGSDIPFFIYGGTALAQGKGERIIPLDPLSPCWVVLLHPHITVPEGKTQKLYQSLDDKDFTDRHHTANMVQHLKNKSRVPEELLFNIFESKAFTIFSELVEYRRIMMVSGANKVNLAGSGPSLYSLFHQEGEAKELFAKLVQGGFEAYVVKTLSTNR